MPKLGRFNHHPDPAIDFEVEVEELHSILFDMQHNLSPCEEPDFRRRVREAMHFRVGGIPSCIEAKHLLRQIERGDEMKPFVAQRSRQMPLADDELREWERQAREGSVVHVYRRDGHFVASLNLPIGEMIRELLVCRLFHDVDRIRNAALDEVATEFAAAAQEEGNDGTAYTLRRVVEEILSLKTPEPKDCNDG